MRGGRLYPRASPLFNTMRKNNVYTILRLLSLLLPLGLIGCAIARRNVDNFTACQNDAGCLAQMQFVGNSTSNFIRQIASNIPIASGVANVISITAGLLGSAVAGVVLGSKLTKKKKEV